MSVVVSAMMLPLPGAVCIACEQRTMKTQGKYTGRLCRIGEGLLVWRYKAKQFEVKKMTIRVELIWLNTCKECRYNVAVKCATITPGLSPIPSLFSNCEEFV
jgi:hypothetical protein